jgi:hypothetical protein
MKKLSTVFLIRLVFALIAIALLLWLLIVMAVGPPDRPVY